MGEAVIEQNFAQKVEKFFKSTVVMWSAIGVIGGSYVYGRIDGGEAAAQESIPAQVQRLVEWTARHDSVITEPALIRLEAVENWRISHDSIALRMAAQVNRLFCDRYPQECDPIPRRRP